MANHSRGWARWWTFGLLLPVILAAGLWAGSAWIDAQVEAPGPHAEPVRVTVTAGQSLRSVLNTLADAGALRDRRAVDLWLRLRGRALTAHVGSYEIPAGATPRQILEQIDAGRVVLESLTIIEGWSFAQMRRAIEAHPGLRQTMKDRSDAELMQAIGRAGVPAEGRFLPDTHRFAAGTADIEIYRLANRQLEQSLAAAWDSRVADLPLKSADEALVLASIVEKETGKASERPRIAGVYLRRLRIGMRLQSDPTVIYGMGSSYDGDIRTRDLTADTPYNTYTRGGLPPTPIALPGAAALRAVARPLETGELFFVATGEADGAHVFTKTYEEHLVAVRRMLARQKARGIL